MKMYLTTVLLSAAIWIMAFGIHTNNFIFIGIGGGLAGVYNAMTYKKD